MRLENLILLLMVVSGAWIPTDAQTISYSGCDSPAEVRIALDTTLSVNSLAKLKTTERDAVQKQVLDELLAKYPRDYLLLEQQLDQLDCSAGDYEKRLNALRQHWVENAKNHPDDALMLLLAGKILVRKDTPEAIRLMETAQAKAPEFPWPAHELSVIYGQGRYADEAKMKENLEKFYSLCPAWTSSNSFENQMEGFRLQKDLPLARRTAVALRARLKMESDPRRLLDYQILWQREFLTLPPGEHEVEREQIRKDINRVEALAPNGDAGWRAFLIEGYKLSGASNEELTRMQLAAVHDFPHSRLAANWYREQFRREHSRPDGQTDAAAWKAYYAAQIEMIGRIVRECTDDLFAQRSELFQVAREDEYISREDGLNAIDRYLDAMKEYGGYGTMTLRPVILQGFCSTMAGSPNALSNYSGRPQLTEMGAIQRQLGAMTSPTPT